MIESFKRYYNNLFLDSQCQEVYNLFLGYYIFFYGQLMFWDFVIDYYFYYVDLCKWFDRMKRDYINWYMFLNFEMWKNVLYILLCGLMCIFLVDFFDDYWFEYY